MRYKKYIDNKRCVTEKVHFGSADGGSAGNN